MKTQTDTMMRTTIRANTARIERLRTRALAAPQAERRPPCPREIDERVVCESGEPAIKRRADAVAEILRTAPGLVLLREQGITVPKLGYLVPDFGKVLTEGLGSVRVKAQQLAAREPSKKAFYDAVTAALHGAITTGASG